MKSPRSFRRYLISIDSCVTAIKWGRHKNAEQMWNDCQNPAWLLFWLAQGFARKGSENVPFIYDRFGAVRKAFSALLIKPWGIEDPYPVGCVDDPYESCIHPEICDEIRRLFAMPKPIGKRKYK